MTISIALKVGDGVVLGADSASTMVAAGGIANVYFNAEKVFNLVKGLPIGVVIAGLGGLSGRSITSLSRDLRVRIASSSKKDWRLDKRDYSIE
jgi:20S proteasome alpha/beta subunit